MHLYGHSGSIRNSQGMETTSVSTNRRVDKDVVRLYNGELLRQKKEQNLPCAATWLELEGSMLK